MNFLDAMRRYHGEIERNLYAAEQLCDKATDEECKACPFTDRTPRYVGCKVAPVRRILGEHRPPGTCKEGTIIGEQILCTALTACGYYWDTEGRKQLLREPSTPDAGARQRIGDVVKELEAQIIDAKKNKNHERVAGYEKAIALLKDGV